MAYQHGYKNIVYFLYEELVRMTLYFWLFLQEHADLVLTSRTPALGNAIQSIDEWLDMRGLDRRLRSSDITTTTPRYDIRRINFALLHTSCFDSVRIKWNIGCSI